MTVHTPINAVPASAASPVSAPLRIRVKLCNLGLAPENLRFEVPEDAEVPRLADTIRAAGVIYPPIVRKGRKGESAFMVLDGRRRRFALLRLAADGVIPEDFEVECLLAASRAAQAAAAVLPNAEHAPVHTADVIVAIGKLRRSRLTTSAIAEALGYEETEVRRLDALAKVHPDVLQAYRVGKLTLTQVWLLARLKDRNRQADFAQDALEGYFHEQGLRSLVTSGRITIEDARFALVTEAAYAEGGGRLSDDLFGELPAEVLDGERLDDLWRARAARTAEGLASAGLTLAFSRERGLRAPDGLEHLPFIHWGSLPDERRAQFDAARTDVEAAMALVAEATDDTRQAALAQMLQARLILARLTAGRGEIVAALLTPARDGLDVVFYQRPAPQLPQAEQPSDNEPDDEDEDEIPASGGRLVSGRWRWDPDIPERAVRIEAAGVSHLQHAARTAMATRGLIRDLADHPDVALIAVIAQLFKHLALNDTIASGASLLAIAAPNGPVPAGEDDLDGQVWRRLAARRTAFLDSGQRPLGFVAALDGPDRMALLAELVAVTVDLREARTTSIRREARAEAEEVAALCGADLARRWTPDDAFLGVHSRAQLLDFLADMKAEPPRGGGVRKDEMVRATAEAAAERRWLPACLRWDVGEAVAADVPEPDAPEPDAEAPAAPDAAGDVEAPA